MKLLFFLFIVFQCCFTIIVSENELEPRKHNPGIDPPPSSHAWALINHIVNHWNSFEALNLNHAQTVYRHPDFPSWRLDFQGPENHHVQGHHGIRDLRFERYAIQGGEGGSQTFAVVHIQRGVSRFGVALIRNAFEQSLATQTHVYLTDDDIERGLNFPNDGNQYEQRRIGRRINRADVWRTIWGTATVVAAMYDRFNLAQRFGHDKGHWKRGEENAENWESVVHDKMAKCIENENGNDKISKCGFDKLKQIYPDYRIFVAVFDHVKDEDKHDAIKSKVEDSIYKENINGKNYAVFRFDKSVPAVTPQSTARRSKIRAELQKAVRVMKRFSENHKFDELTVFFDLMVPYSYILMAHEKADLQASYDTDSVPILDQGRYILWLGIEDIPEPEPANVPQDKMVMKELQTSSTNYASVPTGESTVPSNLCGKRIVGYYTAWGKRNVTENQLKKLTHIIYAFIEMSADGTIKFGGVAEDFKAGENPAEISKHRFLEMTNKARNANSGIKILVAIGGWSNSQHFSSVAADAGKRSTFVSAISNFLKEYKIDGIDIDWEYPVTGGANEGIPADKENYVTLVKELRSKLSENSRQPPYIISIASAAGQWVLDPGYDLTGLLKHIDFINVMTYDYYGAWESKWGAYTGPPSPLFYNEVKGSSGKMNVDWTMKYYACKTKKPSKLNMGVPFYGRFWNNVENAIDEAHPAYRSVQKVNGKFDGGSVSYRDLEGSGWSLGSTQFDETVKAPFIWKAGARKFLGFENPQSLQVKIDYAIEKNIGGMMIWAIDQDSDDDILLSLISSAKLCDGGSGDEVKHKCLPIDDIRWWTFENGGESKQGMCGKSAPLINGFYPICDPEDPGYACCSPAGYCGNGPDFCECEKCINYRKNPEKIVENPVKPSIPIQWYLMDAGDGKRGRCGPEAPMLNGKHAICNPDDNSAHCCSNGFYCGMGDAFCECDGCVDFKKNPNHKW